jgi:hypothetical protein
MTEHREQKLTVNSDFRQPKAENRRPFPPLSHATATPTDEFWTRRGARGLGYICSTPLGGQGPRVYALLDSFQYLRKPMDLVDHPVCLYVGRSARRPREATITRRSK